MTAWEDTKDFLKHSVIYVFVIIPAFTAMLAVLAGIVFLLVKAACLFM